jgi:large subunit ribosomal protein L27e
MLNGRYAGRKAIVVKTYDEGHGDRKFAHAIVAGIDRYPRKITRAMGKKKVQKRSKIKPFIKCVNYSHIMPTRYVADIDLKKVLDDEVLATPDSRYESRKTIKKVFEDR